jgi:hypothetical protein
MKEEKNNIMISDPKYRENILKLLGKHEIWRKK